jgi:hypothetical protein
MGTDGGTVVPLPAVKARQAQIRAWRRRFEQIGAEQGWTDAQRRVGLLLVEAAAAGESYRWVKADEVDPADPVEAKRLLDELSATGYVIRLPVWSSEPDPGYTPNLAPDLHLRG